MTTITGDAGVGWGIPPAAAFPNAKSFVRVRPAETVETATKVTMLPVPAAKELAADGTWSLSIDPLPGSSPYVFDFLINNGQFKSREFVKLVPASGTHEFGGLTEVSPPSTGGYAVPSWVAEVLTARDQVLAAGSDVGAVQDPAIAGRITDLDSLTRAALNAAFSAVGHSHSWSSITGKPSSFTPSPHSHAIADVTGLEEALASAVASVLPFAVYDGTSWPTRPNTTLPVFWLSTLHANAPFPPGWIDGDMEIKKTS